MRANHTIRLATVAAAATLLAAACGGTDTAPAAQPAPAPTAAPAPATTPATTPAAQPAAEPVAETAVTENTTAASGTPSTTATATTETAATQVAAAEPVTTQAASDATLAPVPATGDGDRVPVPPPTCDAGPPATYTSPATADIADITTNQIVTGTIEQFTVDHWLLPLCAGQRVFFDSLNQCDGADYLKWRLIVPDGDRYFQLNDLIKGYGWGCGGDTGPIEVDETGTYTLEVYYDGYDDRSASQYKFEVLNVPVPDEFQIAVGERVGPGLPGLGAGALEYVGSRDRYSIDLVAGQRIFFDAEDTCEGANYLKWRLIVPDGDRYYDLNDLIKGYDWGCGGDTDPITIDESGTYVVEVYYGDDYDATADSYSFTLVDAG